MSKKRIIIISIIPLICITFVLLAAHYQNNLPRPGPRQRQSINSLAELGELSQIITVRRLPEREKMDAAYRAEIDDMYLGPAGNLDHIVVYRIIYETRDGAQVLGFISAPADYLENEYPILFRNRGGANTWVRQRRETLDTRQLIVWAITWTNRGYIVIQTYHRSGNIQISGEFYDQWGGDDIYDILTLLDIAETFNFAAPNEIYMIGESRGGMMTYMTLRRDRRVTAAVSVNGLAAVCSFYFQWGWGGHPTLSSLLGGSPRDVPREYHRRSAVRWANQIRTPMLLLHGERDDMVRVSDSIRVYERMRNANRDVTLITFEDVGHVFTYEMGLIAHEWIQSRRPER